MDTKRLDPCLDENELAAFIGSAESAPLRRRVEEHVDECAMCRALLAQFLGVWEPETLEPASAETSPSRPDGELLPGDVVVGRFDLERKIGRGGTSTVWAAFDRVRAATIALKILTEPGSERRRRMLREARVMQLLAHPAILQVHEVVDLGEDGRVGLVSELLRGMTLAEHFRRRGALSVEETRAIFRPIMAGIAVAHGHGVIHRDLKPANVFMSDGGIKLLDFGLARLSAAEGTAMASGALTQSGTLMGSARYMSLEQLFAEKTIDARADVWALGLMLYEALTGAPAVAAGTFSGVLKVLSAGAIVPLFVKSPALPAKVTSLVDAMIVRDRERRPASVASLLSRLDEW